MTYTKSTIPPEIRPGVYLIQSGSQLEYCSGHPGQISVSITGELIYTEP
jgi:hypothetical protein